MYSGSDGFGTSMPYLKFSIIALFVTLQGCTGLSFKEAIAPPAATQYALHEWPYEEYWTGIVFNGNKIGFSHLQISLDEKRPGTYLISSKASMHFRFLAVDKKVNLYSRDWVNPDLTINGFVYDYDMDGNQLKLYGVVRNNVLTVVIDSSAGQTTEQYPLLRPLYPTSVINLFPAFQGMSPDARYVYDVYDGESQRMTTLSQHVENFESSDLYAGEAYKIKTSMHGQDVTTWINTGAKPLLEMSMNDIFIAELESEEMAKRYLTQAALNQEESLLNFSLIGTDQPLFLPRETNLLELELSGTGDMYDFPNDMRQQCKGSGDITRCRINGSLSPVEISDMNRNYLNSSLAIPTHHPTINRIVGVITQDKASDSEKLSAIMDWIQTHIDPVATDVFTALDVLQQRKAECQGFSYLFASFARSAGIPTRLVNGIVYSEQHDGFLYHTWVESQIDGNWQSIDPIFGQLHADATHIKFVEGDNTADLTPLLSVIGKLSARIVEVETE